MSRRAADEGSIYPIRDKDGKTVRWGGSIEVGYTNGKRKRKKVERKTRREVADALASLKTQHAHGVDLASKQPTVKEFCTPWLENTFSMRAKPKSIETYRQMFEYRIFKRFGDVRIRKVTHRQTQAFISEMHRAGVADKTCALVRAAGRQAWKSAMREGLVDSNPWNDLILPSGNVKVMTTLTVAEAHALLRAMRGERLEVAIRLMLSLGLRRGEVCGLRWDKDVDLVTGTLTVHGTLQYVRGRGLLWGTPKTKSSERTFKLPPSLLAALTWHRQQQEQERRMMGKLWTDSGYVFVAVTTGGPMNSNNLYDAFKRAAKNAGLPESASPHTLRHSCASFLHAEGASLKNISVYLGHSSTAITSQVYVHLFQSELDESAAMMDELLQTGT